MVLLDALQQTVNTQQIITSVATYLLAAALGVIGWVGKNLYGEVKKLREDNNTLQIQLKLTDQMLEFVKKQYEVNNKSIIEVVKTLTELNVNVAKINTKLQLNKEY